MVMHRDNRRPMDSFTLLLSDNIEMTKARQIEKTKARDPRGRKGDIPMYVCALFELTECARKQFHFALGVLLLCKSKKFSKSKSKQLVRHLRCHE